MFALEILSGIGLVVIATAVLSPYWLPPVAREIYAVRNAARAFVISLPARRARLGSHWRGLAHQRGVFARLFVLAVCGDAWAVWEVQSGAFDRNPAWFQVLTVAIALGSILCGFAALIFASQILSWLHKGAFSPTTGLTKANPTNRVGIAEPFGEARFATSGEVDAALRGGGGHFNPPRFRD